MQKRYLVIKSVSNKFECGSLRLFFCEENECKQKRNLVKVEQETIKHNKGNDGDTTTPKIVKATEKIFN